MNFKQWLEGLNPGPQQMVTPIGPNPKQVPINPNRMMQVKDTQVAQYKIKKPQPLGNITPDFPGETKPFVMQK